MLETPSAWTTKTDGFVGKSIRRVEDVRLLTGQGQYIADLSFDGMTHMAVVRSLYPHARILGIETAAAMRLPGVLGVWTGADAAADGLGGLPWERRPPGAATETPSGDPSIGQPQPVLAHRTALYLGQALAIVVAETAAQALDGAEAMVVDYEPLDPLMEVRDAVVPNSQQLWTQSPGNECFGFRVGDADATARAIDAADHVFCLSSENGRLVQNPMETRGYVGLWDAVEARYTLHAAAGKPQTVARALARDVFHLPEDRVWAVVKDVGGGFGAKNPLYPEQALVLWAAKKLGRPVRWLASRGEVFLADYQGRGQSADAEMAFDVEGRIQGFRVRALADLGAYLGPRGSTAPNMWRTMGTSLYHFPAVDYDIRAIHTHNMPTCPYRGAGAPEVTFVLERLLDMAAQELNIAAAEIRRQNLVPTSAMPYKTAIGTTLDSGNFAEIMDTAERMAAIDNFSARKVESEARGRFRGLGYGNLLEACGAGIGDRAVVSCLPNGRIVIRIGTMSNGQSHETVYAQMLADCLDIDMNNIEIVQGDSNETPWGMGTGASRSMTVCGSALILASEELIEKGREIAVDMLEAAKTDIYYENAMYTVAGTDRAVGLFEVAARAVKSGAPADRGLEAENIFDPIAPTYPNGCHIAEVEVDPETGVVTLESYVIAQDVGRALNPMVVEGQLVGGVAQGVGQALLEWNVKDPKSGQLLTGSFMDCAMPRADDLPSFSTEILEIPCLSTPTGVKSVGEAGPTGAPAAVINAVVDALHPLGVRHIEMPATPYVVWKAIQAAND
jgi:carbon-monoxide dehydrogenase large subunit